MTDPSHQPSIVNRQSSIVVLTDNQRKAIHDLALAARELLTREAQELLEGTYGLYPDGRLDPPEKLPQVQDDPEAAETYRRLRQFLDDEERAGLPRAEIVDKLVKEVAFTHINRLVAFKMMEARRLIRGTVDKGTESNGFKFYLADPEYADDYALYQAGQADTAYRHFLLWQSGQIAAEVRVLFDPDTLPSRLFPRPRVLHELLAMLNRPGMADAWQADETIGWIYQFFNEREKAAIDERIYKNKQKMRRQDIPAETQLFTPHWIVRFLVQNTLGRLWVELHPNTRLLGTDLLDYLVPLEQDSRLTIDESQAGAPPIANRPSKMVQEITLLDPACGTMHFGLVAFDLFAAMYQEELDRAGEPGWLEVPSVKDPAEIPAAILSHNLYGIDIDLRAVQLSALALYLKAKALNPKARITDSNLACADVRPMNGARLGAFLREARFARPVYERLIRALWARLQDVDQLGSLLRLEQELGSLIAEERARYDQAPLFAGVTGEFEREAAEEGFWQIMSAQVVQGLDEFTRQQAKAGADMTFFAGEAVKGLRLVDLMLRRYDIVVTNPPYAGRRNLGETLADHLNNEYPDAKGDLYSAFIQRCSEFADEGGRVGMITQQSFMFISSYEKLRAHLRSRFAIETMAHTGSRAFAEIGGEKVNTTVFCLRADPNTPDRENNVGTYFRLVNAPQGEAKRQAFEQALGSHGATEGTETPLVYRVAQRRFDAIPGSPWVYWVSDSIRDLFERLPKLGEVAQPRQGLATADNFRFLRFWWEVGTGRVKRDASNSREAVASGQRWFPYLKGAGRLKWLGGLHSVVNWKDNGREMKAFGRCVIRNPDYFFLPGVTWTLIGSSGFSARLNVGGGLFDVGGSGSFPEGSSTAVHLLGILNSKLAQYLLHLLNPTINMQVGDLARLPVAIDQENGLASLSAVAVRVVQAMASSAEEELGFVAPNAWPEADGTQQVQEGILQVITDRIDDYVFGLYQLGGDIRQEVESEQNAAIDEDEEPDDQPVSNSANGEHGTEHQQPESHEELALRWISYAVGVVLGRFTIGDCGRPIENRQSSIGNAVYRRADFAIGSLPEPDEAEFDQLVGPPERFAYVDDEGGRHLFPAEVEVALRALAVPDGITVLDEGHPRDLPALVDKALRLMLDGPIDDSRFPMDDSSSGNRKSSIANRQSTEVIEIGAGGDLHKFLERDYFTKWHLKWYRKRPVYWPLQSARRSYGFVLFHERVDKSTLYVLQRDYLDHKLNGLRLEIGDLRAQLETLGGAARKQVERQIDQATQLLDEVNQFAQTMARIVREGYEPEPNWIDDGVILRLAPLWELIPLWKAEPRKHWERLERGEFDWSHIAMRYWPERVKEACKTNKSFAIAHGHEEWYSDD